MSNNRQKITFFAAREITVKKGKYFGFFLVSLISILKKKIIFLQGCPREGAGGGNWLHDTGSSRNPNHILSHDYIKYFSRLRATRKLLNTRASCLPTVQRTRLRRFKTLLSSTRGSHSHYRLIGGPGAPTNYRLIGGPGAPTNYRLIGGPGAPTLITG